jgi:hypothetical protein
MIANARMYAINERVATAWRQLFEWIAHDAGVPLEVIAHAPPLSLAELWRRDDLGCALMCGYPWATWQHPSNRPIPLAAPIPSLPACKGRPIYWTDIIVRANSRIRKAAIRRLDAFSPSARWRMAVGCSARP